MNNKVNQNKVSASGEPNDPSAATSRENIAPALDKEPASGELADAPCSSFGDACPKWIRWIPFRCLSKLPINWSKNKYHDFPPSQNEEPEWFKSNPETENGLILRWLRQHLVWLPIVGPRLRTKHEMEQDRVSASLRGRTSQTVF